jgi:tetratricopeptide (TPR) repeat protein
MKDSLDEPRTPVPMDKLNSKIKADWVFTFLTRMHRYEIGADVAVDHDFVRTIWRTNWDLLDLNYDWDHSQEEDGLDGREDIPVEQVVEALKKKLGGAPTEFNVNTVAAVINEVEWQTYLSCIKDDLGIEPENAFDFMTRSHARLLYNDLQGALDDLNEAIRLDPDDPGARINRAELLATLGRYEEALEQYRQIDAKSGAMHMEISFREIPLLEKLSDYSGCQHAASEWICEYNRLVKNHKVDHSGFLILDGRVKVNLEHLNDRKNQIEDMLARINNMRRK